MLNPLSFISKIFKSSNQNEIDKIQYLLKKVNNLEKEISSLEDKDFPKKTAELKSKLTIGGINDEIICQAFALVREASKRKRGMENFSSLGQLEFQTTSTKKSSLSQLVAPIIKKGRGKFKRLGRVDLQKTVAGPLSGHV